MPIAVSPVFNPQNRLLAGPGTEPALKANGAKRGEPVREAETDFAAPIKFAQRGANRPDPLLALIWQL
jgi:hypothetical protein